MIQPATLLTILLMLAVTYTTRIGGYLFLRNRTLGPRMTALLETLPGCVLITVIAPNFVTGRMADLAALTVTALAACRFSILPTVAIAIVSAGLFRHVLP